MRRFDAEYLANTREGMWEDSRDALSALGAQSSDRILDVGSGTGVLTRVLREESAGEVVGVDADRTLLEHVDDPVVIGDALRLPFDTDAFDLVVCQALLINLPDPIDALTEFARVSRDRVAVIEPDNAAVTVESTVAEEAALAREAREWYVDGVETDVTLGSEAASLLDAAGLTHVETTRYEHDRTISPPYSTTALEGAREKASGRGLDDDRPTMLRGGLSPSAYDRLRERWRAMGRDVVAQMQAGTYERTETVPFYVSVAEV